MNLSDVIWTLVRQMCLDIKIKMIGGVTTMSAVSIVSIFYPLLLEFVFAVLGLSLRPVEPQ